MNYDTLFKRNILSFHSLYVKNIVFFAFCFAILFGGAFTMMVNYKYDMVANPDVKTYLSLAHFDFHESPIRRYRVIVPFVAAGINYLLGPTFNFLKPWHFPGPDFGLCMSFMLVNSLLMSFFGVLVYKICRVSGASVLGALTGVTAVLTNRWTPYFAGIPMSDSLYLVVIGMVLYALKTGQYRLLVASILIGPWAKEAFIFIAPLILIFSKENRWKLAGWFLISGILVFSFRYGVDIYNHLPPAQGLSRDFQHFDFIGISLHRLFSFHGLYELFSVFGIWGILFIFLFSKQFRISLNFRLPVYMQVFIGIVVFHALLSTELARMFYLAIPVIAIYISLITDQILKLLHRNGSYSCNPSRASPSPPGKNQN